MDARIYYENQIINAVHNLNDTDLHKFYILSTYFNKSITNKINGTKKMESTGFCGCWEDERKTEEIIMDIENSRTGYGNRDIDL